MKGSNRTMPPSTQKQKNYQSNAPISPYCNQHIFFLWGVSWFALVLYDWSMQVGVLEVKGKERMERSLVDTNDGSPH